MELHFTGIIIAVSTFLIIGLFHPIVIKTEYYTGTRYWWVFLVLGFATIPDRGRSSVGYSWRLGSLQSLEHR